MKNETTQLTLFSKPSTNGRREVASHEGEKRPGYQKAKYVGWVPNDWNVVPFGECIASGPQNGLYKPADFYNDDLNDTPIVRIDSFGDGDEIKVPALRRIRADASEARRYALAPGDLVINRVNSLLMTTRTGDFLISRMQVVHGATGLTTAEFDGAHVSNSYLILVPRRENVIDTAFFAELSKLPRMFHLAYLSSYGVHIEKMTFNPRLYFKSIVTIPPTVAEQRRIVEVLNAAHAEIAALEAQRDALARQKKGLMQRLLTGEVRVTPDAEDHRTPEASN